MAETKTPAQVGVEKTDVDIRLPLWTAIGFLICVSLILVFVFWLLHNPWITPEVPTPSILYPAPKGPQHLQVAPINRLLTLRRQAEARLHSYGWVDRSNRIVHIPIERAMELVARRNAEGQAGKTPGKTTAATSTQDTGP